MRLSPYLSLDPRISIVRHELSPLNLPTARPLRRDCLRVLMVDASDIPGLPPLEDDDSGLVTSAIAGGTRADIRIELEVLKSPTVNALEAMLAGSSFDAVHFVGHAETHSGSTSLIMLSDTGNAEAVTADKIVRVLKDGDIRIALLAACDTASRDDAGTWSGLASELILRGLPAVVAMQHRIESSHAVLFEVGLFEGIAAGLSLDESVSLGRRRITSWGILPEWGVPVLYTRSDGILFSTGSDTSLGRSLRNELEAEHVDLGRGLELEGEGAWDRAAEFYGQAQHRLQSARDVAFVHLRRAVCLWRDGEALMAEECFDRARELAQQTGDGTLLGEIFLEQGIQAEESDQLSHAASLLERALAQFQNSPARLARVKFALARLQSREGHLTKGLSTLRSIEFEELSRDLKAEYWDAMGLLLVTRGEFEDAVAALEDALRLDEELGAPSQIAKTRLILADAYVGDREYERAEDQVDRAIDAFERAGDEEGLSEAWTVRGRIYEDSGELEKALRAFNKAADYDVAAHDKGGMARVNRLLARTARRRGNLKTAEEHLLVARDHLRATNDDRETAELYTEEALLDVARGDYDDATLKLERALRILEADEDERGVALANRNLAGALREMGQAERAIELLEHAKEGLRHDQRGLESLFDELGECLLELGRLDQAIVALKESERLDQAHPVSREAARTQWLLGRVYMLKGDRNATEAHLRAAENISTKIEDKVGLSDTLFELGCFLAESGNLQEARTEFRKALSIDRLLGDRIGAARCNRMLSSWYRRSRDFDRALEYLNDAKDDLGQTSDRREKSLLRLESGRLNLARGRGRDAINDLNEARSEFVVLGAKLEAAACDRVEALARAGESEFETALTLLERARKSIEECGALALLGEVYDELANIYLMTNDLTGARDAVAQSTRIDKNGGFESSLGRSQLLQGEIERRSGSVEAARIRYEQALRSFDASVDHLGAAEVELRLGDLCVDSSKEMDDQRLNEAVLHYRKARSLYQEYRDSIGITRCLRKLGEVFLRRKQHERARETFEQAEDGVRGLIEGASSVDISRERAALSFAVGRLDAATGRHREAVMQFENALSGYRKLKREDRVHDVLRAMAATHQHLGEIDKSLECIRQIGIEQARIVGVVLDYLGGEVETVVGGPYRDGDYRRAFDRSTMLIERAVRSRSGADVVLDRRVTEFASKWVSLAETLATNPSWEPSSIDALSAAALAHLVVSLYGTEDP